MRERHIEVNRKRWHNERKREREREAGRGGGGESEGHSEGEIVPESCADVGEDGGRDERGMSHLQRDHHNLSKVTS